MPVLDLDVSISFQPFSLAVTDKMSLDGITALFGPSGCGKSTLLRIISGLETGARGHIRFGEETWLDSAAGLFVPPHRRGVGYMFQDTQLFPHLSVAGNLRYAERRSRVVGGPIDYAGVVRALDLAPLLDRRPRSLSGGERQRVAIGRTLLTRPRLLLMDEPLAALDVRRKGEILPYIEQLPQVFGVPVIYVTHAVEEVAHLASRVIVLSAGRKIADSNVAEMLERLDLQDVTGRFEAGVVLTAQVIEHDMHYRLTYLSHGAQRIVMPMVRAPPGRDVRIRIRARDVALATQRPQGTSVRNILAGILTEIVEEPDTAFAETLVDIGGANIRARVTRAAIAELELVPGAPVFAMIKSVAFDRRALMPESQTGAPEPLIADADAL